MTLFFEQLLNGLQFSLTLLLVSSGLTLVFGTMHLLNLAHGSFFMIGAYAAAATTLTTGSWLLGLIAGLAGAILAGLIVEALVLRRLYRRGHLDQVLATFALILIFNEGVRLIWGIQPLSLDPPTLLRGSIELFEGVHYPIYRLAIICFGLIALAVLVYLIAFTRLGMRVRAGAFDFEMMSALGVPIERLNMSVFLIGCALAAFAGIVAAPYSAVQSGMGEPILILAFVVVVIGGIGSIKGAIAGSLLVGMTDTMGRAFLEDGLKLFLEPSTASALGTGLSSMLIFLIMAIILAIFPSGLFSHSSRGSSN